MSTTVVLDEGADLVAKQMQATTGESFPRHKASRESVLVVTEGRCLVHFDHTQQTITAGETVVIPAGKWHQVVADPGFTAVHVMPRQIRFTFSAQPRR